MLYFEMTSEKLARAMAETMTGWKKDIRIYTGNGNAIDIINGNIMTTKDIAKHFDAYEVRPDMSADELKNARRIASGRETLRAIEEPATAILEKGVENMRRSDIAFLLSCLKISFHTSGKIEGLTSIDSCASCAFCRSMIEAATKNPLIICGGCYADRDKYKEASWRRHTLNARILSTVLFHDEELATLPIESALTRFNEDGDTVNRVHAQNLLRIARTHKQVSFGWFFKNSPAVEAGLYAEGYTSREKLPENIRFIQSSILIGIPARAKWFSDAIFTVYATHEATEKAIENGAHACNGRKCMDCGFMCYLMKRRAEAVHIAEYFRAGADLRKIVCCALTNYDGKEIKI